jgi:glycosyltransferase involved in cell wall biosynthesis
MENNPIISIIVPIYNVELYLHKCIDSLILQTYSNIEIILVNDGSPDNCGRICDEYAQKDSRIKIIHKVNGGLVSARNAGYELSSGDWIMYLDGDDWIEINTCEILVRFLNIFNDVDLIFWNTIQKMGEKSILQLYWKSEDDYHIYRDKKCIKLSLNTLVYSSGIATAYSKLIKRAFCEQNNLIHNNNLIQGVEGVEFSMRVFYAAKTALHINQFLTNYRYNSNSISKRIDEKNSEYIIDGFVEIQKFINNMPVLFRNDFQEAMYQRVLYALIAISMSTYFHPNNKDAFFVKIRKFKSLLKENIIFEEALNHVKFDQLDRLRRIAFFAIKYKFYFLLYPIAVLKYILLKRELIFY